MFFKLFIFLCINIALIYCVPLSQLEYADVSDENVDLLWKEYKQEFNKDFDEEEDAKRKAIFVENMKEINMHNYLFDVNQKSYKIGINEFSHMSYEEFNKTMNGGFVYDNSEIYDDAAFNYEVFPSDNLPESVDHRDSGIVTPVENQGACGSCWTYSALGALESQHAKATGNLIALSKQQLLDCNTANYGCRGGWMNVAYRYIMAAGGINTADDYPYAGAQHRNCYFNPNNYVATMSTYVNIPRGDENAMKSAIALHGPVAVAVDASPRDFMRYRSGVMKTDYCSQTAVTHAILAVGYGTDPYEGDYWLVKNSWGTTWGENGYIKMARNYNNMCGIAGYSSYPKV